jgi:two-component system LytT family response regulator
MIRTLIIDDEPNARQELGKLLKKTARFVIVGECENAVTAVKMINKERPEVIFLDIQMPVIGGFELLSMIDREIMPHVVFVTAYDEFAIRAFEERTLDYLLKPVRLERLEKTLEKLQQLVQTAAPPRYETERLTRIPCVKGNNIKLIAPNEVEYAFTDQSGAHLMVNGEIFNTDLTLKALEERSDLLRCHRKCLVNIHKVDQIIPGESGTADIKTTTDHVIPVSRRHLKELKRLVGI